MPVNNQALSSLFPLTMGDQQLPQIQNNIQPQDTSSNNIDPNVALMAVFNTPQVQQAIQGYRNQNALDDQTQTMLNRIRAIKDSGVFDSPYQKFTQQHPVRSAIGNAMMAFAQGITKQPYYTDAMNNQAALQKNSMDMIGEAARYGQLTPEQQFMNQMRLQQMQNSQDTRDQNQWTQFVNKINPTTASSRSTVGMTANGNLRANRALATIQNNPVMTYQDLGNVIADLAGIYQGGSPTDMGMRHQQYDSIQSRVANLQQFLTGKPQDAVPPEIKTKIMSTIQGLKDVNNAALKNHLDSMEKAQAGLIAKHPEEWQQYRQQIENDYMNGGNPQQGSMGGSNTQSFTIGNKTYNIPSDKVDAFKKAKGIK